MMLERSWAGPWKKVPATFTLSSRPHVTGTAMGNAARLTTDRKQRGDEDEASERPRGSLGYSGEQLYQSETPLSLTDPSRG
jgi:hypothetical protein